MYLYIFYLHIWNISEFDQKWQCRRFSSALQNWLSLTLGLFSEGFEEELYRYPSVLNVIKCLSSDKILFVLCALVNRTISSFEDSLVVNPKHQLSTLRFYHWAYNLHSQGKLNRTSESAIRQKQSNWPFRTLCFFYPNRLFSGLAYVQKKAISYTNSLFKCRILAYPTTTTRFMFYLVCVSSFHSVYWAWWRQWSWSFPETSYAQVEWCQCNRWYYSHLQISTIRFTPRYDMRSISQ